MSRTRLTAPRLGKPSNAVVVLGHFRGARMTWSVT
jgi:hypothetical protein